VQVATLKKIGAPKSDLPEPFQSAYPYPAFHHKYFTSVFPKIVFLSPHPDSPEGRF
jgi:hypothetical protein